MAIQTSTTGLLERAQNIMIDKCRFTMEHNQPCVNMVEHIKLPKGHKSITVPKVGQMTAHKLVEGVDLVTTEDMGLTSGDLTVGEVGLKVIVTDILVDQFNEDVLAIYGRQMGDAMARIKDTDVIALFPALNGSTAKGADDKSMTYQNVVGCITWAKKAKLPRPISIVHHPNAVAALRNTLSPIAGTAMIPVGESDKFLKDFWAVTLDGVNIFHDGNILEIGATDSAYGAIFSKSAMCVVDSVGFQRKSDEDISLRATEVVVTARYGCWELDDGYGAAMRYEIGDLSTSN